MGKEDDPLTPYHIIRGEQDSEAVQGDLAELIAAARHDQRPVFEMIESFAESHTILQMAAVGVLVRLDQLGAVESERILTDMEELDPENPITNNLSTLASVYDGQWHEAFESEEREELRRLAGFAHAAFAISAVVALHSREREGSTTESMRILPDAGEAVMGAHRCGLSGVSIEALEKLLDEVRADIENPELP
ncbi:MAG TPA: hypothetical protein VHA05_00740 [Candidatus Saccharimonadales bacterium]|nr:hypothetical protein [Candidatus Saccharimonadales bacterium]